MACYDALIMNSPIASVITNPRLKDNPIVACNEAFVALTGYSKQDIVGRNCRFLAGSENSPWFSDKILDGVIKRRPVMIEVLNYKCDGTPFRNAVTVAPLYDAQGELEFFLESQVELDDDLLSAVNSKRMNATRRIDELSQRQREVLAEMALGNLNKQIAHNLNICEQTVKMHRALVLVRLNVSTTAEAIRIAVEANL